MVNAKLAVTAVLLTGGESRRMGRNKAFLDLGGKTLLERSLEVLNSICQEVVISSRETDLYSGYGYKVIEDKIKGKGPLGGLYSVLTQAEFDELFLVACDMPFLNAQAITCLYQELEEYEVAVPYVLGRLHPLHAFYRRSILPAVEKNLLADKLRFTDLFGNCRTKIVRMDELLQGNCAREVIERSFINANTPEEWEWVLEDA
ncbi:MAG TPA: molybdenum cofactor guanylyltransferase [Peptococcaceae bacterium]|nr:molybdenum cofactor guanylyltransferase [Peptococcaceae bacterium]